MEALYLSILIFLILAITVYTYKPVIMFDKKTGQMKQFGVGHTTKTIFYYPYVMIVLAVFIYFILKTIELKQANAF